MSETEKKPWFLYIILSSDDLLYTGITTDIQNRWRQHSGQLKNGAKFFRGRKPKKLLYVALFEDRSSASKVEYQVKSLSKKEKLLMIDSKNNRVTDFSIEES